MIYIASGSGGGGGGGRGGAGEAEEEEAENGYPVEGRYAPRESLGTDQTQDAAPPSHIIDCCVLNILSLTYMHQPALYLPTFLPSYLPTFLPTPTLLSYTVLLRNSCCWASLSRATSVAWSARWRRHRTSWWVGGCWHIMQCGVAMAVWCAVLTWHSIWLGGGTPQRCNGRVLQTHKSKNNKKTPPPAP